jgi:hypothetical protein
MLGSNGGLLGKERLLAGTASSGIGLWLPNEQSVAKRANKWPLGPNDVPNIGDAFQGGFFAGYISHTANGVPTHALIVAPAATGASGIGYPMSTRYDWKPNLTSTPGTTSTFDGRANTDAMITAGIGSHPAANFCVGLSIGGYTDWYLPAIRELEIAYFNLKPNTTTNSTSFGINNYSVPIRAANYTGSVPAMTSASAFNSVGAERFNVVDARVHQSSTESSSSTNQALFFGDGSVASPLKYQTWLVRAFRRVPV